MARPWRAQGRGQKEIGRRSHLIESVAPLLAEGAVRVQRVVPGGVGVVMEHLGQEVEKVTLPALPLESTTISRQTATSDQHPMPRSTPNVKVNLGVVCLHTKMGAG